MDDRIFKNVPVTKFDHWKFWKPWIFFIISSKSVMFLFYNVYKENMFTIKIEDGREVFYSLVLHKTITHYSRVCNELNKYKEYVIVYRWIIFNFLLIKDLLSGKKHVSVNAFLSCYNLFEILIKMIFLVKISIYH